MHPLSLLAVIGAASVANAWTPANRSLSAFYTRDAGKTGDVRRWLYGSGKVRGVNLGSLFISEPWMMSDEWSDTMGCGDGMSATFLPCANSAGGHKLSADIVSACSEFDCMIALGQDQGNQAFQAHWGSWITPDDIETMSSLGLNTIRIPLGYWINEDLVDSSEHFPQGALPYLDAIVGTYIGNSQDEQNRRCVPHSSDRLN